MQLVDREVYYAQIIHFTCSSKTGSRRNLCNLWSGSEICSNFSNIRYYLVYSLRVQIDIYCFKLNTEDGNGGKFIAPSRCRIPVLKSLLLPALNGPTTGANFKYATILSRKQTKCKHFEYLLHVLLCIVIRIEIR